MRLVSKILISGTLASIGAAVVLSARAKQEGRQPAQPINATSHWVHGDQAANRKEVDLQHTAVGFTTHWLAALLWAALFEELRRSSKEQNLTGITRDAVLSTVMAAIVDYVFTPKRLTPGWELVLSRSGMALGYLGMAAGLVIGEFAHGGFSDPLGDRNARSKV